MAKLSVLLFLLSTVLIVGYGKHIHPRNMLPIEQDILEDQAIETPIEMISQIQESRFVPINNVLVFQRYPPCEEGFERDLLGVCREVWE